jgi:orotidine-5'-phosphate decarboxylase
MDFKDKLIRSALENESIACMGLDLVDGAIPEKGSFNDKSLEFLYKVFTKMNHQGVLPGAIKFNHGFYEIHDKPHEGNFEGSLTLAHGIQMVRKELPNVPIILDFKRGDIGKSSKNYAIAGLINWNVDAVTVHGYMGTDSVMPFADLSPEKGVYVLTLTSNKGSEDFQLLGTSQGRQLYGVVASKVLDWARPHSNVGMVFGATHPKDLEIIVDDGSFCGIPLLIPGVGDQEGDLMRIRNALHNGTYNGGLARINSSSGITHPWKLAENAPKEYAIEVVKQLDLLNKGINYRPSLN